MTSCGHKNAPQEEAPIVDVTTVKGVGEVDATTFTGRTKSAAEVNLAFRVAGQIERVLVKEGDYVQKGQVVAIMDARDYQVQLAATQAEYEQVLLDENTDIVLGMSSNFYEAEKAGYELTQAVLRSSIVPTFKI